MKKLRNGVLSSGDGDKHKRKLMKGGLKIVWAYWLGAVAWDRKTNSRPLHHKIKQEHLHPNGPEKMRNHLAEDMLDQNMLHLMKMYQASLKDGSHLAAAVDFLQQTSNIIQIFHDKRPVMNSSDPRLHQLQSALQWFQDWTDEAKGSKNKKMLPSWECLDDVRSMLVTFKEVCLMHLEDFPGQGVVPARYVSYITCRPHFIYNVVYIILRA